MLDEMLYSADVPPEFCKALALIGSEMHPAFDRERWITPGKSKESCVLSSLAVYDFLRAVGFSVALTPVYVIVRATDLKGRELHSLGVGDHQRIGQFGPVTSPLGWSGHLVVLETKLRCFVDTTLYQCRREKVWPELHGMVAAQVIHKWQGGENELMRGMEAQFGKRRVRVAWFSQPDNVGWLGAPDTQSDRRANVVAHLIDQYRRGE